MAVSMADTKAPTFAASGRFAPAGGIIPERTGSSHPYTKLTGAYETADGWMVISISARNWKKCCEVWGRDDWLNHPVLHEATGKVEITCQNHNYAVDPDSARRAGFHVTHHNLYDGTVEGLVHEDLRLAAVQYHPEASPGPHDAFYLWKEFLEHVGAARAD